MFIHLQQQAYSYMTFGTWLEGAQHETITMFTPMIPKTRLSQWMMREHQLPIPIRPYMLVAGSGAREGNGLHSCTSGMQCESKLLASDLQEVRRHQLQVYAGNRLRWRTHPTGRLFPVPSILCSSRTWHPCIQNMHSKVKRVTCQWLAKDQPQMLSSHTTINFL